MNRQSRRAEGVPKKRAVGYRGQAFEVRAAKYGSYQNFVVGWANNEIGVANLVNMINKHPIMSGAVVKKLTEEEKAVFLNKG